MKNKISENYSKLMPRNCPVIEHTADGVSVGVCTYYLKDGMTCPRHGKVKEKPVELKGWSDKEL